MNRKQHKQRRDKTAFVAMSKGQITPREADRMKRGWLRIQYGCLQRLDVDGWSRSPWVHVRNIDKVEG